MEFPFIPDIKPNELNSLILDNSNPSILTYISLKTGLPISVPVWVIYYEHKFYFFTGEKSVKARTIQQGNDKVSLIIVHKDSFPVVYGLKVPYLSVSGHAKRVDYAENEQIASIFVKLLEKYTVQNQATWIYDHIQYWKDHPTEAWLIEITPEKAYYFNE